MTNDSGSIIPLAWPDAPIAMVGRWYDPLIHWLGFAKDGYCNIGHAAVLLIKHGDGEVFHMDFGRYHTPLKKGRARDKETDPELAINTKAIIKNNKIVNLKNILQEVYDNPSSHGKGRLIAGEKFIPSFKDVYFKAKLIQNKEALEHGPFTLGGSNCSRFVSQVSKAGKIGWLDKLMLYIPYTVSPSPVSNVRIINDYKYYYQYTPKDFMLKHTNLFFWKKSL